MNKILNVPEFLTNMTSLEVVAISNNPFTSSLPKYVIHSGCFLQYLKSKDLEIKEHFPDIVGATNTEISIPQGFFTKSFFSQLFQNFVTLFLKIRQKMSLLSNFWIEFSVLYMAMLLAMQ